MKSEPTTRRASAREAKTVREVLDCGAPAPLFPRGNSLNGSSICQTETPVEPFHLVCALTRTAKNGMKRH